MDLKFPKYLLNFQRRQQKNYLVIPSQSPLSLIHLCYVSLYIEHDFIREVDRRTK